jgi:membrane fusion protein, multidrug efflux system
MHAVAARAQAPGMGPPAVGVVRAETRPIVESSEYIGRIQSIDRVSLVARVTAFIEEFLFTEGSEVKKGDLLYRLERPPFEADLAAKQATVAQEAALLTNANVTLQRAQRLLGTPAGQQSTVDDALAQQRSIAAQLMQAQSQVKTSQINLDYTEIRAPVDGKISRTALTIGNVVSPSSGALATIVSQDPMYVLFPVPERVVEELANKDAESGGLKAQRVRLRLPDGNMYPLAATLDYVDPTVAQSTDTILLRGRIGNPLRPGSKSGDPGDRPLYDGEFVTVVLEGVAPVSLLAVPRAAVLADQQGYYVFVIGPKNVAQRKQVTLGQSEGALVAITSGLNEGEMVIVDGLQRVRPNAPVMPGPAAPLVGAASSGAVAQ